METENEDGPKILGTSHFGSVPEDFWKPQAAPVSDALKYYQLILILGVDRNIFTEII